MVLCPKWKNFCPSVFNRQHTLNILCTAEFFYAPVMTLHQLIKLLVRSEGRSDRMDKTD